MTNKERRKLQSLIRKHVAAQINLTWKVGVPPDEREQIEAEAKEAKNKLNAYLSLLVN